MESNSVLEIDQKSKATNAGTTAKAAADAVAHMDYLADMIHELTAMAERANAPTLARLLDTAFHEARIQMQLLSNR